MDRRAWAVAVVVTLLLGTVVGVVVYGELFARTDRDVLARRLCAGHRCSSYDGWGWSHLLLYTAFGLAMPGHYLAFGALGVAWETWEYAMSATRCTRWDVMGRCQPGELPGEWWYAKASDLVFNMVGYTLGSVGGHALRGEPLSPF